MVIFSSWPLDPRAKSPTSIQYDVGWVPGNNALNLSPFPHTCSCTKTICIHSVLPVDTGWRVRGSNRSAKDFLPSTLVQNGPQPAQLTVQWVLGLVPGAKAAGAWRWPPLHLPKRLKKEWSCTSISTQTAWHVEARSSFLHSLYCVIIRGMSVILSVKKFWNRVTDFH